MSTTGSISFWSLKANLSATKGSVLALMSIFFIVLPTYLGPSGHTLIVRSSLKVSLIDLNVGSFNFRLFKTHG